MIPRAFSAEKVPAPPMEVVNRVKTWLQNRRNFLAVEIGCGVGLHPIRFAIENPDKNILAIERTEEKFQKFAARVENHQMLPNLLPVHADAQNLLPHVLIPESVDQFFILYPNPYPKAGQKNLRLAYSPFMHFIVQSLKPAGRLIIATNIETYKNELIENLGPLFTLKLISAEQVAPEDRPRTHFEKKYLSRGETCWNLTYTKP